MNSSVEEASPLIRYISGSVHLLLMFASTCGNVLLVAVFVKGHTQFKSVTFFMLASQMLVCDIVGLIVSFILDVPLTFSGKELIQENTSLFSTRELKLLIPGLILTAIRGLVWPAISVIYGQSFKALSDSFDERNDEEVKSKAILDCILFAIVCGFVTEFGARSLFGIAGEKISQAKFCNVSRRFLDTWQPIIFALKMYANAVKSMHAVSQYKVFEISGCCPNFETLG
ncbi:multidrug resistance protein pgp-3 [Ditylenchus destructor]|uniref:Multidrug resistance protein pgp-3 n=1 Tax=Ditylenchus destructor TaxID=166010 RepID=A0AAD4QXL9_9BILA|nr:multidrug resistance protein pgp-3 [Ditylenchus destructor]